MRQGGLHGSGVREPDEGLEEEEEEEEQELKLPPSQNVSSNRF